MIREWSEMEKDKNPLEEDYLPIFCEKHYKTGIQEFKMGGRKALQSSMF